MSFTCRSALLDVEAEMQPGWLAIPADVRGNHRALLVVASKRADGGRIVGCKRWSVQQWYQQAGFHPRYQLGHLKRHKLIRWDGEDLWVAHYIVNHEERLRWLSLRGPELTAIRKGTSAGSSAPSSAPSSAMGSQRVNPARSLKTPPTVPLNGTVERCRQRTPDPDSDHLEIEDSDPPDQAPPLRTKISGPPVQPEKDRTCVGGPGGPAVHPAGDLGPEGFEQFLAAMPVPEDRQPRDRRVWPVWRERMLLHWVRFDLEGEADEILEHVERKKETEEWKQTPWFIPSGINFLRAAEWRQWRTKQPEVKQPDVWPGPGGQVEVYERTAWPGEAPRVREHFKDYLKSLVDGKVSS